ncbi:hypothetical protein CEE69_24710 [Rhodopirellula bahusiensis]|uniref:Uncharacterized protein n=1 Tax=Rhodopirellula bahusiensis TaxID=2014065 RepID=A0A2G1W0U7_9BACT|nr:hypothetical protein CEE69_24710 [Rhodopirellula bahusiensis]
MTQVPDKRFSFSDEGSLTRKSHSSSDLLVKKRPSVLDQSWKKSAVGRHKIKLVFRSGQPIRIWANRRPAKTLRLRKERL